MICKLFDHAELWIKHVLEETNSNLGSNHSEDRCYAGDPGLAKGSDRSNLVRLSPLIFGSCAKNMRRP